MQKIVWLYGFYALWPNPDPKIELGEFDESGYEDVSGVSIGFIPGTNKFLVVAGTEDEDDDSVERFYVCDTIEDAVMVETPDSDDEEVQEAIEEVLQLVKSRMRKFGLTESRKPVRRSNR